MKGVLLLAAGSSRRFGSDKRHQLLASGLSLLETCLDHISTASLPALVVLRHDDFDLVELLATNWPLFHFLRCPDSALGMGHSLAFGVEQAANRRFTGLLIALADMPFVLPATYSALAHPLQADKILIPRYQGHLGHPVGFGSDFFSELRACRGDAGGKAVWQQHRDRIEYLEIADDGILKDIDLPLDFPTPPG